MPSIPLILKAFIALPSLVPKGIPIPNQSSTNCSACIIFAPALSISLWLFLVFLPAFFFTTSIKFWVEFATLSVAICKPWLLITTSSSVGSLPSSNAFLFVYSVINLRRFGSPVIRPFESAILPNALSWVSNWLLVSAPLKPPSCFFVLTFCVTKSCLPFFISLIRSIFCGFSCVLPKSKSSWLSNLFSFVCTLPAKSFSIGTSKFKPWVLVTDALALPVCSLTIDFSFACTLSPCNLTSFSVKPWSKNTFNILASFCAFFFLPFLSDQDNLSKSDWNCIVADP